MIPSIRRYLLANLLFTVILAAALTALSDYYIEGRDIAKQLDITLEQTARTLEAAIGSDINTRNLDVLQKNFDNIPKETIRFRKHYENKQHVSFNYTDRVQIQVWNKHGKLLLHSSNTPTIFLGSNVSGFVNTTIGDHIWRVFTLVNEKTGVKTIVAERFKYRKALTHQLIWDNFYILLWIFPVISLLIWFIVGYALKSLQRVADDVANRAPIYLEPVNTRNVPIEVKPILNELNRLFLRLQDAFERNKRFAADAAHELRTPLAALKTQTQVAVRAHNEEEKKLALNNILAGVDRSAHIVEQLLTLSRLNAEDALLDIENVKLTTLASEIIAQQATIAVKKNVDVELRSVSDNIIVKGNTTALSILLRNLVDNAIRYTPEGGSVSVSILRNENQQALIRVIDTGPGIPPELRGRIFERFFRILGNKSQGSGLGLAIVKQIADLHNAEIQLGSPETGTGLKIDVIFPKNS